MHQRSYVVNIMNELLKYRTRKITVELLEKESVEEMHRANVRDGNSRIPEVPFGFINDEWEKFKFQIVDGDEIWYAAHTWGPLDSWGGYLLVRKDKDGIETVVTAITCWVS
jgi:hypothetical protein